MKRLGFAAAAPAAAPAVAPLHEDEHLELRIGDVRPALDLRPLDSEKPASWAHLEGRVVVIDTGSRCQPWRPSPIPPDDMVKFTEQAELLFEPEPPVPATVRAWTISVAQPHMWEFAFRTSRGCTPSISWHDSC